MFAVAEAQNTREDPAGGDAALQARHQLLLGERAGVEELLHQRVVCFGDHLDERFARRLRARLRDRQGSAPSLGLPLPSARRSTPSSPPDRRRRGTLFSSPIGSWIGNDRSRRTRRAATRGTGRGWRARGRAGSARPAAAAASSSAAAQTFSVDTSTPATASTTTSAASATRSAARASLRKFAIPGVSMKLILVLFHSA